MLSRPFSLSLVFSLARLTTLVTARGKSQGRSAEFDWSTIEPSPQLVYHDCNDGFKCARLQLPLDWQDPTNNGTVAIAITALPAVVPESDPSFGGTIVVNPGGPGGAGTAVVLSKGRYVQTVVDGAKHYEILSFDPRGVSRSDPNADCYGDEFARQAVAWQKRSMPALTSDAAVVDEYLPYARAHGQLCARDAEETRQHFSTPAVARDMLGIVDAVDALRKKTLRASAAAAARLGDDDSQKVVDASQKEEAPSENDLPRLQYMGFSYGTVLGNTFASLFPGRVGRVLLDGVVDPYDYTGGLWRKNLMDAEHIVDEFFASCFARGDRCSLREPGDTGGQSMRARVEALIESLDASPAVFLPEEASMPVIVHGSDVRALLLAALYFPVPLFLTLDMVLALATAGEMGPLASVVSMPAASDSCSRISPPTPGAAGYSWIDDTQLTYICGDAESSAGMGADAFAEYVGYLEETAPLASSVWASVMVDCTGWTARPKWRFAGPFVTPAADARVVPGKPAAPLLILSTRYDPVTPLANAHKAAKGHPGSAVVVQNSSGHTALFASPSQCTKKIVERFFELGEVPADGAVCDGDCQPFETCQQPEFAALGRGGALREALPRFPLGV